MGIQLSEATNSIVILVDYSAISSCNISRAFTEIAPTVGSYVAEVIHDLNLNPEKVEIIGHSLGANIAGFTGAAFGGQIGRITGYLKKVYFSLKIIRFWINFEWILFFRIGSTKI